jgi:transcriptional regulator with XRE-family HTH domain
VILKEIVDMKVFERIKKLADKQGKSLNRVEEELGLSKNVLYRMKSSDNPTKERLEILADYFDVSVDYLLGRDTLPKRQLGPKGELIATHVDDDVSEEDMNDILKYIEFRKNNPL